MKPNWTVTQRGCSVSRMWKMLAALVLVSSTALAQEQFSAYDALRVVGVHTSRDAVNHVVSVTGVRGNPQPQTWRVLIDDRARGGIREVQVRNGRVSSDRPSWGGGLADTCTMMMSVMIQDYNISLRLHINV